MEPSLPPDLVQEVTVVDAYQHRAPAAAAGTVAVTVNGRRALPQPPPSGAFHLDLKEPAPSSVLRSQSVMVRVPSGFQRPRVSFPATGKNRRRDDTPPVKRELPAARAAQGQHQFGTLPASLKKRPVHFPLREAPPGLDMSPSPPSVRSSSEEDPPAASAPQKGPHLFPGHVKQSSFDSGILGGISSVGSVSSRGSSVGDSCSETNSEMGV